MRRILVVFLVLTCYSAFVLGQSGSISGHVVDASNNEDIIGANVYLENNQSKGASTDIDGRYQIDNIAPGAYSLVISYVSYQSKIIQGVQVKPGLSTTVDAGLSNSAKELQEVVVRTDLAKENVNSLMAMQKNNSSISDGISSDIIKKTNDKNTSDALRRVNGVTIQNNKFAIIRGLSDRYNNALINGTPLPSTEPDRKTFSFDLIPSSLVDNIVIIKTAQPDLPGDFAGGIIRVNTRDIPDENFVSFSLSGGVNTLTTFTDWYTQQKSSTDWLGLDDGLRALPTSFPETETLQNDEDLALSVSDDLPNTWGPAFKASAPMNKSIQVSSGLKSYGGKNTFGAILGINYADDYRYNPITRADYNFDTTTVYRYYDDQYKYNVTWGVLLNLAYKMGTNNRISFKNNFTINTDNITTLRNGTYYERGTYVRNYAYYFSENKFLSSSLEGDHFLPKGKVKINWSAGYNRTARDEPDYRKLFYNKNIVPQSETDTAFLAYIPFGSASPDLAGRFYSSLFENIYSGSLNVSMPFQFLKNTSTIKAGAYLQLKDREFDARVLGYVVNNIAAFYNPEIHPDPNAIFALPPDQLLDSPNIGESGFRIDEITNPSDAYTAASDLQAYYLMFDNVLPARFRLVWGARIEMFHQQLTSSYYNNEPVVVDTRSGDLNQLPFDLLPSANLIFSVNAKTNLRLSASKTVSRPEFRELAPFSFYDFTTSSSVTGNDSLSRTNIFNLDFRAEKYWGKGQVISGSVYYKNFTNPIEQIIDLGSGAGSRIRTYENVKLAENFGIEFELRKNFEFMKGLIDWSQWENISFNTNLAYIRSIVDFTGIAGVGDSTRPLQGQSPFIVNAGLQYTEPVSEWGLSIFFNEIGRRIDAVGTQGYLDIYEAPRPLLDAQISKRVLKTGTVRFSVSDILAKDLVFYQDQNHDKKYSEAADTEITVVKTGTRLTLSFSYKF